ncbi:MAG: HAD-IIIC family phosphatase, partial [Candidatus Latescibacteria bacterium]|nr:HAD-IIIC family phosphatase [Candidatus Latescibacterota bacterium]
MQSAIDIPSKRAAADAPVLAISATFTCEPVADSLDFWSDETSWPCDVHFAPYNQVFQQLLNPESHFVINHEGLNVVLVKFDDWLRDGSVTVDTSVAGLEKVAANATHLISAIETSTLHTARPHLISICPPLPDTLSDEYCTQLEETVRSGLGHLSNVYFVTRAEVTDLYPVEEIFDLEGDKLGHLPYTSGYFSALGTLIFRRYYAIQSAPYKVIVLDCDHTLWRGVCAEDGPEGVEIDTPYHALQSFMIQQRNAGMLLCLCSKNVEEDVTAVFDYHATMPIARNDLVSWRINWRPKSENIKELAQELQLGLDSFIFVDDNPIECAEVQSGCPEALTLLLPVDPSDIPGFLAHIWAFDHLSVTEEDRKRTDSYRQNVQRRQMKQESLTLSDFLAGLKLEVSMSPPLPEQLGRLAQLTLRTNQFNFTTIRRTEAEIASLLKAGELKAMVCEVRDRFGDYGLVGVILYEFTSDALKIDTFLLSCRVLGRGVEHRMLAHMGTMASELGLGIVDLLLRPTSKNRPALDFIDSIGVAYRQPGEDEFNYLLPTAYAVSTRYQPVETDPSTASNKGEPSALSASDEISGRFASDIYRRIAIDLNTADRIVQTYARPSGHSGRGDFPLLSDMEGTICGLWQEALNLDDVGIHDNFFDIGGTSLLGVRLIARLREQLNLDLSIVALFENPTIHAMAKAFSSGSHAKQLPPNAQVRGQRRRAGRTDQEKSGLAIVGMAGGFPGARNVDEFWQNLIDSKESITFLTNEEIIRSGVDPAVLANPNYVKAAPILDDPEMFDASFFGYAPREAQIMDPQHRLFLEWAWQALEHAGYSSDSYDGSIGIYAGASMNTYLLFYHLLVPDFGADFIPGLIANDNNYMTTRASYKLNLGGPGVTVQTACSTSLVAFHMACQSLWNGECDMAMAGGVSVRVPHQNGHMYQEGGIFNADGHVRTFDAKAGGTIIGSGGGVIVLKRLEEAIDDGDCIYAVAKGSAINNDGSAKADYTAPSVNRQSDCIAEAMSNAGVDAESISYIEAHGTGTVLGDPIEIAALTKAFRATTAENGFCAIGSVKTNIGHLDAAAGMASLIKTALALKNKMIPASLNYEEPNPEIDFESSPFYVNDTLREWTSVPQPIRAGVNSLGIGGTNAHVILEEPPQIETGDGPSRPWQLLVLSAKTESALNSATARLASHLRQQPDSILADVAYTLKNGRRVFDHRRVVVAQNVDDAIATLEGADRKRVLTSVQKRASRELVFMFPGQGAQYPNMGLELYETEPEYRAHVDYCSEILRPHLGLDIRDLIYPPAESSATNEALRNTLITQPALFVVEYALARLWMSWDINPTALIGHSIGEYVAATLAGVFTVEEALGLVATRGRMIAELPGGSMLSVSLTEKEVAPYLEGHLSLAAVNSPSLCVISGDEDAVTELEQRLSADGRPCKRLHTSHAFHSSMMESIVAPFTEQVRRVSLREPGLALMSTVTGNWVKEDMCDPEYWARNLRQTVHFSQGAETLLEDPNLALLEVGPGKTLSTLIKQHKSGQNRVAVSSLRNPAEKKSDMAYMLESLGRLWMADVLPSWSSFYTDQRRRRVPLPTYPFERKRYWIEDKPYQEPLESDTVRRNTDKLPVSDWFYTPSWKRSAIPVQAREEQDVSGERWLVFLDAYGLGTNIIREVADFDPRVISVAAGASFSQLDDGSYCINPENSDDYSMLIEAILASGEIPNRILHLWSVIPEDGPQVLNTDDAFETAQVNGFYSLLYLTQALGRHRVVESIQIEVVSNGLHDVSGDEHLIPEKTTILAACKVIPQEYPNIACRNIDIVAHDAISMKENRLADRILLECRASRPCTEVAYRGSHRWEQVYDANPISESSVSQSPLKHKGTYLITGGLGNIGYLLAQHLAEFSQARLVLSGRTALPERAEWQGWLESHDEDDVVSDRIRKLSRIESLG